MLISHRTLSARNIPTYAATRIRTKEPRQVMREEILMTYWRADARAYAERAAKTHQHTGVKMVSKKADETIQSAALDILSQTEWMTVTEVSKAMGCGYSKARNALERLVTSKQADRRIVSSPDGMRKRALYRVNAKAAHRHERDAAMLDILSKPKTVKDLAEFSGLSVQRVTFMLGEWIEQGKVQKEWISGPRGTGRHLWKRKEGGE